MAERKAEITPIETRNPHPTLEEFFDEAFPGRLPTDPQEREKRIRESFSGQQKHPEREGVLLGFVNRLLIRVVRTDQQGLSELSKLLGRAQVLQAREAQPPMYPLEDPRIVFGYIMALHDTASLGRRFVVPLEDVGFVLRSKPAMKIITGLAEKTVIGAVRNAEIPDLMGVGRRRLPKILKQLEERGLIKKEIIHPKKPGKFKTTTLTAAGQGVSEILGLLNPKDQSK